MLGIQNNYVLKTDQTFTSNATLATIDSFTQAVSVGQIINLRGTVLFTVGATGGIRFQIIIPAGGSFILSMTINNTVTPAQITHAQLNNNVITAALAVAGDHFLNYNATYFAGATAGNVAVQMAQNTSDANTLTLHAGANLVTTIFNQ